MSISLFGYVLMSRREAELLVAGARGDGIRAGMLRRDEEVMRYALCVLSSAKYREFERGRAVGWDASKAGVGVRCGAERVVSDGGGAGVGRAAGW